MTDTCAGVELQSYRIEDYYFLVETSAVEAAGRRAFRATAYVLMTGDTLRQVCVSENAVMTCVGPAVWRARDELVNRLSAHLRAVARRHGGVDAAALERRGMWVLPRDGSCQ